MPPLSGAVRPLVRALVLPPALRRYVASLASRIEHQNAPIRTCAASSTCLVVVLLFLTLWFFHRAVTMTLAICWSMSCTKIRCHIGVHMKDPEVNNCM